MKGAKYAGCRDGCLRWVHEERGYEERPGGSTMRPENVEANVGEG